jgi:hypothetical protein
MMKPHEYTEGDLYSSGGENFIYLEGRWQNLKEIQQSNLFTFEQIHSVCLEFYNTRTEYEQKKLMFISQHITENAIAKVKRTR